MTSLEFAADGVGPVAALRRRWWIALVLLLVGAVIGVALGARHKPLYTAESRLVVGNSDLSSYQVPGFALASQQLAGNYARYVDNSSVVSRTLTKDLGPRIGQLTSISASPITNSDVISIEAVATSRVAAIEGAQSAARTLVKLTASSVSDDASQLLKSYTKLASMAQVASSRVGDLESRLSIAKMAKRPASEYTALTGALNSARTAYAQLNLQADAAGTLYRDAVVDPPSDSRLSIITGASIVADSSSKTVQIYTAAGAVAGLLLALVIANLLERRRPSGGANVFISESRETVGMQ